MSENELTEVPAVALGPIRPLSVRITDGLRAQLEVITQFNDRSVTEEIRSLTSFVTPGVPPRPGQKPPPVRRAWWLLSSKKSGAVQTAEPVGVFRRLVGLGGCFISL